MGLKPHSTSQRFGYAHGDHGVSLNYSKTLQKCGPGVKFLYLHTFSILPLRFCYDSAALGTILLRCRCASVVPEFFQDVFATIPLGQ